MTIVERFKQARKHKRPSWGRFVLLVNELAPTADPQTVADNIRNATGLEYDVIHIPELIKLIKEEV